MSDKMSPQEIQELASRIAEEFARTLSRTIGEALKGGIGKPGMCGSHFASCGNYECSSAFDCYANPFRCTGKFTDNIALPR